MKPVAVIVVTPEGVRVESIKSGTASVLDKAIDTIGTAVRENNAEKKLTSG